MQQIICKNCEYIFQGNFCSSCGQKSKTQRLDWHFLNDEMKYTFLHINNGLLYTAKQLFVRPGDMIREFIDGKRVRHYKPILLVFVLAGISGLLLHYSGMVEIMEKMQDPKNAKNLEKVGFTYKKYWDWVSNHYSIFQLFFIPFFALNSWLAFRKWGYNYIENIIINCFITSQQMIYGILIFPLTYIFINTDYYLLVQSVLGLPVYGLTIWTYLQLYKNRDLGQVILRLLLYFFYIIVTFIIIMIIATIVGIIFAYFNPEFVKSIFQP